MLDARWYNKLGFVASNQLLIEACVFLRNVIIARLIGAETLGEFIFLILSIRLFSMSTDLAVERYILQTKEDNVRRALSCAHFICQTRSGILALILVMMGLHSVQGISSTCYLLLAAGAFVRGFTHQGYRLKQRSLNFRPALYVEGGTAIIATFAMYVTATAAPTLEAMCAVLLAQAILHTAFSHIMSDSPYETNSHLSELKSIGRFGLPLMFSGMAMFWSMQGERVILSTIMPAAEFAHFSMLFQLALVPVLIVGRIALTTGLPALAKFKGNHEAFHQRLGRFHIYIYAIAIGFATCFVLVANPALMILFGAEFKSSYMLIALVAIAQTLRLCRTPQSVAAQALGQTDIPFKANLVRVSTVFIAFMAMLTDSNVVTLLIIACVGEGLAWATQGAIFSMRNRNKDCQETISAKQEALS